VAGGGGSSSKKSDLKCKYFSHLWLDLCQTASDVFGGFCRSAWHMLDVVPILQRLRWGHLKYAPLRYKNSPGNMQCGACSHLLPHLQSLQHVLCDFV